MLPQPKKGGKSTSTPSIREFLGNMMYHGNAMENNGHQENDWI
jgi:hypothetical protein